MTPPAPTPDAPDASPPDAGMAGVARSTVDIAAPPERVYRALTDPAERARWWGADPPGAAAGAPPAGPAADAPRTVEFTWRAGWDDRPPGRVRYDLAPAEVDGCPGTRVTVTHTGPTMRAGRARAEGPRPAWLARRPAPAWAARRVAA